MRRSSVPIMAAIVFWFAVLLWIGVSGTVTRVAEHKWFLPILLVLFVHSPQDMMLYALSEKQAEVESLRCYDFLNWYGDEPDEERSKSYVRIVANNFTVTDSDQHRF